MHLEEKCVGLSLELSACLTARAGDNSCEKRLNPSVRVPPSVICTSVDSRQFELDQWFPANPIGSGENWPPEAQVGAGRSRRMPLALLWDLARREKLWEIDQSTSIDPIHAIANAARDALSPFRSIESVGLVVPNWLRQAQQQNLLDSLSGSGLKWRLVWRPIAAATYWIQHFFKGRPRLNYSKRTPIGKILCLQLGLLECEWTVVELVAEPHEGLVSVLPARRRIIARAKGLTQEHQPGFLSDVLVASVASTMDSTQGVASRWRQMWSTPWLLHQLASWCGGKSKTSRIDCPPSYCPNTLLVRDSYSNSEANCDGIRWPTLSFENAKSWVHRKLLEHTSTSDQLDGAVVFGELASVLHAENRLDQFLDTNIDLDCVLVADVSAPHNLLAIGAMEQCRRMGQGRPSFLTKLPLLRTVVSSSGDPKWISLLAEDDPYVYGGRKWDRPEPVRGIKIPRSHILRLAIDHEDFDTVRETSIAIPELYQANIPSEIHVTITPSQGNAKVEIRPLCEHKSNKQLLADLSQMDEVLNDQQRALEPNEYIDWVPRIAPPLLPRLGSAQRWNNILSKIISVVSQPVSAWQISSLRDIRTLLRDKVATYYPRNCTAVGSDGIVEIGHECLLLLGDGCVKLLASTGDLQDVAMRCLAYSSYDSSVLAQYIREKLVGRVYLVDAEYRLVGNCIRDTEDIGSFFSSLALNRRRGNPLKKEQIRTIAEIACYRANTFEHVKSDELTQLYQSIAAMFERESSKSNLQLHFRYLTLCMAFLLRRRIFDDSFIDPEGELAVRVKASCERVIDRVKRGQIQIMGGAVDVPAVMRQLIEFVDRQGRGSFVLASD